MAANFARRLAAPVRASRWIAALALIGTRRGRALRAVPVTPAERLALRAAPRLASVAAPPRHRDDDDCAAALAAHAAARHASPDHVAPAAPRDHALGACGARHPHRY
jgi:hypothetical protein